jgi:hypothetical protein
MLGVSLQVAEVGLGMATGSVQQHQHRKAWIAGMQIARARTRRVEVTLRERDALEVTPDALVV